MMNTENEINHLEELLKTMGQAGERLTRIEAAAGTAGNLSVYVRGPLALENRFPIVETIPLPLQLPELAGAVFLVTGSGRRLSEVNTDPTTSVAALVINPNGRTAQMHTGPERRFNQVTSEFNSHLAVHYDQILRTRANFHAIVHAQPPNLTYLSHVPRYQDPDYLNRHILRWEPETIYHLPEGVGFIPFEVPGSPALMDKTVQALSEYRIVIWAKHGVMARSDRSIKRAADLVEYAEVGAKMECLNLANREIATGMSDAEIRQICREFNIAQRYF
jgi:rhamnulose-1-phosphate aldolase